MEAKRDWRGGGGGEREREEEIGNMEVAESTWSCLCGRMSTRFSCNFTTCLMSVLKETEGTGDLASHCSRGTV